MRCEFIGLIVPDHQKSISIVTCIRGATPRTARMSRLEPLLDYRGPDYSILVYTITGKGGEFNLSKSYPQTYPQGIITVIL
jgi:hypothetical protein